MTKEEFITRVKALVAEMKEIEQEIKNVQEQYKSTYPVQPGDMCLDSQGKVCWIKDVSFWQYEPESVDIVVNYQKADGTRAKRALHLYSENIKKIETYDASHLAY